MQHLFFIFIHVVNPSSIQVVSRGFNSLETALFLIYLLVLFSKDHSENEA